MSKENCSIPTCARPSQAFCYGCKTNFCREHMFEHRLSIYLQLNPLIDQTNQLYDEYKQFDDKTLFRSAYQQLEEWQEKSHQTTETYFAEKTQDLDAYVSENRRQFKENLEDIQRKIIVCRDEQETTHEIIDSLTFEIQNLQRNINRIKQNDIQIPIKPLIIDPDLNDIQIPIEPLIIDRDLTGLNEFFDASALPPVYHTMNRTERSSTALATNNHWLLLHHQGALLLVNKELVTYRQTPWTYGSIYDMCYSATLNRFIIINENEVFLLNEVNMMIEKVHSIKWQEWFSCTCSDSSLYLSTKVYSSSLIEFRLLPAIVFYKKWPSSIICTENEAIDGIIYRDNTLALIITNDAKRMTRLELRSTHTLGRIWSLLLDHVHNERQAFRFCSINFNQWLVADHHNARFIQITKDGKIRAEGFYQPAPCCAIEFGNHILAVSTESVIYLHKR